mmetsp:Transcript_88280/g.245019  ORF Transcript_88280/g.245019 Transcript_88280/m.245019 type:complete len:234 (-) Transcript_88280:33-734(-)
MRTSKEKRSTTAGAMEKVCRYKSVATLYVPSACMCSQLRATAVFVSSLGTPPPPSAGDVELHAPPGAEEALARCGSSRVVWYSRNRFRSFMAWPRGIPRSFMSESSMSAKVSKSSKPFRSKVSTYWPRPASFRKVVTGQASCGPAPASPPGALSRCSRRRSFAAWQGSRPRSRMSESSMSRSVSMSSKPIDRRGCVYWARPRSLMRATTSRAPAGQGLPPPTPGPPCGWPWAA